MDAEKTLYKFNSLERPELQKRKNKQTKKQKTEPNLAWASGANLGLQQG